MDNNLHHVLREISNLQLALNKAGGPTKNGELFEEILQIQWFDPLFLGQF